MRKIVVTEFMSLDGVVEAPHNWSFPYWTDEIGKFKKDELFASDTQLLGRATYEAFAEAWPERTDEDGYADRLNKLPKYVVSKTLKNTSWNNSTIISGDIVSEIKKIKQQPGQNILVHGSPTMVHSLMKYGLVDEFQLLVFPLILGKGLRLFRDEDQVKLRLLKSATFDTGVAHFAYEVIKD
jgi:dihydrofolate reductase